MDVKNTEQLNAAIEELERRKTIQRSILKSQLNSTLDHFKPKNLIKNAISNVFENNSETTNNILKTVGGLGAGMVAKSVLLSNPTSMVGKLAVRAIQAGAAKKLFDNKSQIAAWGTAIVNNLFKKK